MPRSVFVCLAIILGGAVRAEEPDATATLTKAKKAYAESTDKARAALLEACATATKNATASGNLDVVKALQAEKEAFENGGKLPTSARMKTAALNYQLATRQASATMEKGYEQAVKELTKAGKLAQAEAVQAELKEFRTKASSPAHLRPADVMTKEDLQKYLTNTSWTWGNCTLRPDGVVESKDWGAYVMRWDAVDRRTVVFFIEKGRDQDRIAVLLFSEDITEFRGYDFNGKDRLPAYKRKP